MAKKDMSGKNYQGGKDKQLEKAGLLNYQTKNASQGEIAQRVQNFQKSSGIRIDPKWAGENWGTQGNQDGQSQIGNQKFDKNALIAETSSKQFQVNPILDSSTRLPSNPIVGDLTDPTKTEPVWDYKTATADMKGNVPLSAKIGNIDLSPQGFTPSGEMYFGSGPQGWIKKMAYKTLTAASGDAKKQEESLQKIYDGLNKIATKTDWQKVQQEGLFSEEYKKGATRAASGAWDVISGIWGAVSNSKDNSLLTVPIKTANVAVEGAMDAFQVFADTAEKTLGMTEVMRNYNKEHGTNNAADQINIQFDPVKIKGDYQATDRLVDTFLKGANPYFMATEATAFLMAPGTWEEKGKVLEKGWQEGKMLYSELVNPSIEAEYKRRLQEPGADPELLIQELQDPFAEMVGEMIVDPLNVLAPAAKANKFANVVTDASKLGGVTDQVVDTLKVANNLSNDADGVKAIDDVVKVVQDFGYAKTERGMVQKVIGKLDYKLNSLNAAGKQTKTVKSAHSFLMFGMGDIKAAGGGLDDGVDMMSALYKMSSENPDEVKEAVSFFTSSKYIKSPLVYFGDQAMETSHLIRNTINEIGDFDSFLNKLRKAKPEEQAGMLKEILDKASKTAYPSIADMSTAYSKVKLNEIKDVTGKIQDLEEKLKLAKPEEVKNITKELDRLNAAKNELGSAKNIRLAQEYQQLIKERPALGVLAKFDYEISKPIGKINAALANVYFTNYGFAIRNFLSNQTMIATQAGVGAWVRDGKFLTDARIERELAEQFPAGLPAAFEQRNITQAGIDEGADIVSQTFKKFKDWGGSPQALAANIERRDGMRVFYKFYRDTMDQMLDFGKGLPGMEKWAEVGYTPEMAKDFQTILRSNGYNSTKALEVFKTKYADGVDLVRQLDWVEPKVEQMMREHGVWDDLVKFVNPETGVSPTKDEILKYMDELRTETASKAMKAVNDPIGVAKQDAVDIIEKFPENFEETKGYAQLQQNVNNAARNTISSFRDDLTNARHKADKLLSEIGQEIAGGKVKPERQQLYNALSDWIQRERLHTSQADNLFTENGKKITEAMNNFEHVKKSNPMLKFGEGIRDKAFRAYLQTVEDSNEAFYKLHNVGGNLLAEDFAKLMGEDITQTFKNSRQAVLEYEQSRNLVAGKKGGLFHVPPQGLKYSEVGSAGHDGMVAKLADYFGISSIDKTGEIKQDQKILNIVNKYTGGTYVSLKDVPMEEAQKAFAIHAGYDEINVVGRLKKETQPIIKISRDEKLAATGWMYEPDPTLKSKYEKILQDIAKRYGLSGSTEDIAKQIDKIVPQTQINEAARASEAAKNQELFSPLKNKAQVDKVVIKTTEVPRSELPPAVSEKMANMAETFKGKVSELVKKTDLSKEEISVALDKVIQDQGVDVGNDVEVVKEEIIRTLLTGDNPDVSIINDVLKKPVAEPVKQFDELQRVVEDTNGLLPAVPQHIPGTMPTEARGYLLSQEEINKAIAYLEDGMLQRLNRRSSVGIDKDKLKALIQFEKDIAAKTSEAKLAASKVGTAYRDLALHAYGETTNADHLLSLVLPYHFWYTRTYSTFAKSIVPSADILAAYAKWKEYMSQTYKDQPEWFKYNVKIPDFMGVNKGNPIMFNMEASIWPLQGLTGVDFNDPDKRANWFTASVDDAGKFGPSIWAPIQWGIATYYAAKGEKDMAAKWGGRMIPQTALFKATSSFFGSPIELDPNVQIFSGNGPLDFKASDPYEEGKVSRALAAMEAEGIPQQQLLEAARTHTGPLWEEAQRRAVLQYAPGQIMSSMLGVGFKPRTQADIETDNFYRDYSKLRNSHNGGLISDQEYKQGFNTLRTKYPFMDVILLSRRAGVGREEAYAYNVISRIPPGMTSEIYKIIGVDPETAQKFYDSGGKTKDMSPLEKENFLNAMAQAGAVLSIPSNATRKDWSDAKNMYQQMQGEISKRLGDDIQDKVSLYFGIGDQKDAKLYLDKHPEVQQALDLQNAYIVNNPKLMTYYGGIDRIEKYYKGEMYDTLVKKYGEDITKIESGYFDLYSSKDKKAYLREHPELKPYWDEKSRLKEETTRRIVQFGSILPKAEEKPVLPQNASPTQKDLYNSFNEQPKPTFQEWQTILGEPMTELIQQYWYEGDKLPKQVTSNLDYMAKDYGYSDGNALLQDILISMQ